MRHRERSGVAATGVAAILVMAACAMAGCTPGPTPAGERATPVEGPLPSPQGALIPPGYGTLRQDDIAVRVQLQGVQVKAIPLDESIIRVLSPDSYRALRDLVESKRDQLATIASRRGLRQPKLWYVSYFGLEPEARFSPMEFVITSAGREFRPVEIVPLSTGWGQQRLRQREVQSAIYLFEDGVELEQPLIVTVESARDASWAQTLRRIERERALVRSRAGRGADEPRELRASEPPDHAEGGESW